MSKEQETRTKLEEDNLLAKRTTKSWCSERFLEIFQNTDYPLYLTDCAEYVKRHRVLDFIVTSGRVSAKIQDNGSKLSKVELLISEFSEEIWEKVFEKLVTKAYFIAKLLAGELPLEVESIYEQIDVALFPRSFDKIRILYNNEEINFINKHIAAVIYRLSQKLEEDPFCIFLLRGCGREELITNLRKLRRELRTPCEHLQNVVTEKSHLEHSPTLTEASTNYWSCGNALWDLSFNIKADELPAAILKWLDPLPLSGLEEKVDFLLEEAYAQVARRAHAFGLGL